MTPKQIAEALRVRRRREERALAALQQAQAMQAQAEAKLAEAKGALAAFDSRLEASLHAFEERAKIGLNPHSIMGMRAFHADQLKLREAFHDPIALAEGAVSMAQDAVANARHQWKQASQAADNLQEMSAKMATSAARDLERRQEQDRDEIAATRAARASMEQDG